MASFSYIYSRVTSFVSGWREGGAKRSMLLVAREKEVKHWQWHYTQYVTSTNYYDIP